MVCHETYKDEKGNWLRPDEVETKDGKKYFVKNELENVVTVGPSSPCQNQKKTL